MIPDRHYPNRDLHSLAGMREQARLMERNGRKNTATQLVLFGVCPCVALGRYDTCCKIRHGALTHA